MDYTSTFIVAAIFLVVGAVVSLLLIHPRREDIMADSEQEAQALTDLAEVV